MFLQEFHFSPRVTPGFIALLGKQFFHFLPDVSFLLKFIFQPGAVTASSRAVFIEQQVETQKSPQPNFTTLAVYHSCDAITFRWHLNFPTPVAGIDVLIVEPGTHLVKTDYSEYNSFGLLLNFGTCNFTST